MIRWYNWNISFNYSLNFLIYTIVLICELLNEKHPHKQLQEPSNTSPSDKSRHRHQAKNSPINRDFANYFPLALGGRAAAKPLRLNGSKIKFWNYAGFASGPSLAPTTKVDLKPGRDIMKNVSIPSWRRKFDVERSGSWCVAVGVWLGDWMFALLKFRVEDFNLWNFRKCCDWGIFVDYCEIGCCDVQLKLMVLTLKFWNEVFRFLVGSFSEVFFFV